MVLINKFIGENKHANGQNKHPAGSRPCVKTNEQIAGSMKTTKCTKDGSQKKMEK